MPAQGVPGNRHSFVLAKGELLLGALVTRYSFKRNDLLVAAERHVGSASHH